MIKKARAIEIIKELLRTAQYSEQERGYFHCDDFEYYALMADITNEELIELGFVPIDDEVKEREGFV